MSRNIKINSQNIEAPKFVGALFGRTFWTLPDPAVSVEGVAMGRKKKPWKGRGTRPLDTAQRIRGFVAPHKFVVDMTVGNITTKDKLSRTRHGHRDIVHYVQQTVTDDRVIRHIRSVQVVISAIGLAILLEIALIHGWHFVALCPQKLANCFFTVNSNVADKFPSDLARGFNNERSTRRWSKLSTLSADLP